MAVCDMSGVAANVKILFRLRQGSRSTSSRSTIRFDRKYRVQTWETIEGT